MNRLAAYRKLIGMNQTEMAKELNISLPTYCMKETGKNQFTHSEMIGIIRIIQRKVPDITADEIFFADNVGNLLTRRG